MTSLPEVLKLLADGQFHSGETLARHFGVSRTAIWKVLAKLEALGVEVYRVSGKGYRLAGALELLQEQAIRADLDVEVPAIDIHLQLDSTNHYLMSRPELPHGYVCLAESQTQGRGRRGRVWQSPFGGNIYMSFLWEFNAGLAQVGGVSLATAIGVSRALTELGVKDTSLKWPNDILFRGQKLAGILLEVSGESTGPCRIVAGLGLNVHLPASQRQDIDQPVIDLQTIMGGMPARNRLVGRLISHVYKVLHQYETEGMASLQAEWHDRDVYLDRPVVLNMSGRRIHGVARGINAQGELVLQLENGERVCYSGGELSLRLAAV